MRITRDAKQATRARILATASKRFRSQGFEATTIRDIAGEINIATGTIFNYFESKEEVVVALAEEAILKSRNDFHNKQRKAAPLREDLFLQISTQIRCLKPLRNCFQPVIDAAFSTPTLDGGSRASQRLRAAELEAVDEILREHGIDANRWSMTFPIYWGLYVGVLTFWAGDGSPKQEDTLAMLDQSINMFVSWLESNRSKKH
jgi:AcrR family transcriptional regulator